MKGIDVSHHNGWPFNAKTDRAYRMSDFVIFKATQGTGYKDPHRVLIHDKVVKDGKLWGFYHYAAGHDPKAEADHFYATCKQWFGYGIPVIDWESNQNPRFGNTTWVRKFVNRIHELTGVWCMIYVQASAVRQCANCADDCALWVAGYPDYRQSWSVPNFHYSTAPWKTYTLWQFTSGGGVDRNVAKIDADGWNKLAKAKTGTTKKSVETIAKEVIDGKYGTGETRRKKLEAAGYDYAKVQAKVNALIGKSIDTVAREVIDGDWGNGDARKRRLKKAGYDYAAVQRKVNEILNER